MALSKELAAAVINAGLDPCKYPNLAALRLALRRSDRELKKHLKKKDHHEEPRD